MCIEKVESWGYGGKLYPSEQEAVITALTDIATRLIKDHATNPLDGLVKHRDQLVPLLARHAELFPTPTPTEVTSGNGTGEPKQ